MKIIVTIFEHNFILITDVTDLVREEKKKEISSSFIGQMHE